MLACISSVKFQSKLYLVSFAITLRDWKGRKIPGKQTDKILNQIAKIHFQNKFKNSINLTFFFFFDLAKYFFVSNSKTPIKKTVPLHHNLRLLKSDDAGTYIKQIRNIEFSLWMKSRLINRLSIIGWKER